jgi:hypothetical protein
LDRRADWLWQQFVATLRASRFDAAIRRARRDQDVPVRRADPALADNWTWGFFLTAAEKCFKGGYPFGMPMSTTGDAVNWVGTMFAAHGVRLVDEEGNITVNSDATRLVLEWFKKAVPFFPPTVFAWNNASNNKALISGVPIPG